MESDTLFSNLLLSGLERLSLDLAIISRVANGIYTVYRCESKGEGIPRGSQFDLADTYCSDVLHEKQTKYYRDVAEVTELLKHPCYLNTQLRAYIGTPIWVNGEIWGTLNYSSLKPHKSEYTSEDIAYLEDQARRIASLISQINSDVNH